MFGSGYFSVSGPNRSYKNLCYSFLLISRNVVNAFFF